MRLVYLRLILLHAFVLMFLASCKGGGTVTGDPSSGSSGGTTASSLGGVSAPLGDTPNPGTPGGDFGSGGGGSGGGSGGGGVGNGGGGGSGGGGGNVGGEPASVTVDPGVTSGGQTRRVAASFSGSSDQDGFGTVSLTLSNTTSFQVVTEVPVAFVATLALLDPSGATLQSLDDNLPPFSDGLNFVSSPNSMPYPSMLSDTRIVDGTYTQELGLGISSGGFVSGVSADFTGTIVAKNDPNLSAGLLRVNLFLVGNEAQKASTRLIINQALTLWNSITTSRGVQLSVQTFDVTSDTGIVPIPALSSSFTLNTITSVNAQDDALNVFIGEDISADTNLNVLPGGSGTLGVLGIAPGRPGPAIVTTRSAVAISLILHQGGDGVFSSEEAVLFAETITHEAGHYLGLMHPVEIDPFQVTFIEGDRLADTPVCNSIEECVSNGVAMNSMFPTPVPGVATQQVISSQQGGVVNLQAIVD